MIKSTLAPFQKRTKVDLYEVFTALAYLIRTGCQWKMLPSYYPKPSTVYYHFRTWCEAGWQLMPELYLREQNQISAHQNSGRCQEGGLRNVQTHGWETFAACAATMNATCLEQGRWHISLVFSLCSGMSDSDIFHYVCAGRKFPLPRPLAVHLCPLVSVTMEPHCSLTARTNLRNDWPPGR